MSETPGRKEEREKVSEYRWRVFFSCWEEFSFKVGNAFCIWVFIWNGLTKLPFLSLSTKVDTCVKNQHATFFMEKHTQFPAKSNSPTINLTFIKIKTMLVGCWFTLIIIYYSELRVFMPMTETAASKMTIKMSQHICKSFCKNIKIFMKVGLITRLHYINRHESVYCGIVTYGNEDSENRPLITAESSCVMAGKAQV